MATPPVTGSPSTQPQGAGITRNQIALPANLVQLRFGHKLIGYLDEFSAQEDFGLQPLTGIGDARAQEWVPGMYNITITATRGILMGPSIFSILNGASQSAGASGGGSTVPFGNMDSALQGMTFDCVAQQKGQNGTTLRTYRNCSFASVSISIRANAIIMANITLRCLDASGGSDGDFSGTGGQAAANMDTASGN
jgi:hypothetical protein